MFGEKLEETMQRNKVYVFGERMQGNLASAEEVGFKAYNLMRMFRISLPIPSAFVLGTGFCRDYFENNKKLPHGFRELLTSYIRQIELGSDLSFGGSRKPLLVSVRSGTSVSMPGMMDTILNVGLCDETLRGVLRMTGNPRLVWDCYRRLVQSFAEVVHGCESDAFEEILKEKLDEQGVERSQGLDFRALADITQDYLNLFHDLTGKEFPQNPFDQLQRAVEAVFKSWNSKRAVEYRRLNNLSNLSGTAVTVQRMVFGNAGGNSGAGVAFTRNPATGENQLYMDFLFNAQGEDVVSGRSALKDSAELEQVLPDTYQELLSVKQLLEREFKDAQEFEFTVQDGKLFILQTRTAKRTPLAALKIAVEQVCEGLIEEQDALKRLEIHDLNEIKETNIIVGVDARILCEATPASVGVVFGEIALDSEKVVAKEREGKSVILVRKETSTADIAGIASSKGILTSLGGRTSHAAVVARQMNKVCLVGCENLSIDLEERGCLIGDVWLKEGDTICLDANTGKVLTGQIEIREERPHQLIEKVNQWMEKRRVENNKQNVFC